MEINNQSMNNGSRSGRFTSSKVWQLIDSGRAKDVEFSAKGIKYIQEKVFESRFETTLDTAPYNEAMAWGNLMEQYVYELIGFEYRLASKDTLVHPEYDFWSGTPDCIYGRNDVDEGISEIKCYGKKKFAMYVDCMEKGDVELFKKEFPQEYWQIVSNACIMDLPRGEALAFMPYRSQYEEIKEIAENMEGSDIWKYRFIIEKNINDLNFLPDDGYYDSINKFEFKIPRVDKMLLTSRIKLAQEHKLNYGK
jgi:hypothetical protein